MQALHHSPAGGPPLALRAAGFSWETSDGTGRRRSVGRRLTTVTMMVAVAAVALAGESYPVTIDPYVQQAKLTASVPAGGGTVGASVAVNGDTVAVGVPGHRLGDGVRTGAVYVYQKGAAGWTDMTPTAVLTANDAMALDQLGTSVAIWGDTIVAGAPGVDIGANGFQGAVYLFRRPATGWATGTQAAKLTASDGAAEDRLGDSVAISDGTVVAGAPLDDVGEFGYDHGSAYVFERPVGGWASATQSAKLTLPDPFIDDRAGRSVAVTGDTVALGVPGEDVAGGSNQGAVAVFVRPATGWGGAAPTATLSASDGVGLDEMGRSVSISAGTIVAGAHRHTVGAVAVQGSVYVFERAAGGWATGTEQARLHAPDLSAGAQLGFSVGISDESVVAGAHFAQVGSNMFQGAAYVFDRPATGWAGVVGATSRLEASDGAPYEGFGFSVATAGDTVVAGVPNGNQGAALGVGSAYVFTRPPDRNDPPTVAVTSETCTDHLAPTAALDVQVRDDETSPEELVLTAASTNGTLIPSGGLVVEGAGATRRVTISASSRQSGTALLDISVDDGTNATTLTVEVVVGTGGHDRLVGGDGADILFGLTGDDAVDGNGGDDLVCGGPGADTLRAGPGADTLMGGLGDDDLDGGDGADRLLGEAGDDRLRGGGDDDVLTGGSGADSFGGGQGSDAATDVVPLQGDSIDGTLP